jgi:hypothetical protein
MHGTKSCKRAARTPSPSLPATWISQATDQNSGARQQGNFPLGAVASIRPFAHSQRLPVAEPPLQGRCSRPVSSASRRPMPKPGLPPAPALSAASTQLRAKSLPETRLFSSEPAFPASSDLHSPSGILPPSGSKRSVRLNHRKTRLQNRPDLPSLPEAASITSIRFRSTLQVRYRFRGSLFLKTSWNLFHYAPNPADSQMKFAI